ncbi:hypothetical protein [Anaeroselena agilis]|uniref:Uncharacterized protein n=1 Tax=Anaeroselena agilis TaxID=3063788 RepID=A0ABU3P3F8_9FIRM|nr:hypothetical protein [Selenomonadales bacterium 4137-cl]
MDKDRIREYRDLFAKKARELWDDLGDEVKWAKDVTEIRLQMEILEAKQDRLFKEYGKTVFLTGQCEGPAVDTLLKEIGVLEDELQKKYLALQKLKAES